MSAEFPVVAFLQNCWFRPGTNPELIRQYLTDQKVRRFILARSMTGRRLSTAFGEHYYRRIWWDNASEHVANTSPGKAAADLGHMFRVIEQVKPRAMLAFGTVANEGLQGVYSTLYFQQLSFEMKYIPWHYFPHPNARGLTQAQINEFAATIITRYL